MSTKVQVRGVEWYLWGARNDDDTIRLSRTGEVRQVLTWKDLTENERENVWQALQKAKVEGEARTEHFRKLIEARQRREAKMVRSGKGVYIDHVFWHMDFERELLWIPAWEQANRGIFTKWLRW